MKIALAAFAVSITEPPPTATKESAPASLAAAEQASTVAFEESCSTASKTPATSRPPPSIPASTFSTRPVPRITASVTISGRFAPSFMNSKPVPSIIPRPAAIRVGWANW